MSNSRIVPAAEKIIDHYFPVLDHGFVALKDYMGSDLAIEQAARASYGKGTRSRSDTRHLLRYLMRHGHASPFEMASVRLHIGLPIVVMRQLVRQRTAKLNEYSGRYSEMPLIFYKPDEERVTQQSETNKQGSGPGQLTPENLQTYFDGVGEVRDIAVRHYRNALASNVAREVARNDLPLSTYTYLYWKIDMRNMFNLLHKRLPSMAQPEYRAYARVLAGIANALCPLAFEAFQDYQENSVNFSQAELAALAAYYSAQCHLREPSERTRQHVNEILHANGINFTKSGRESREQTEFWEKLQPKTRSVYELDLSTAKSPAYYEKLVQENL